MKSKFIITTLALIILSWMVLPVSAAREIGEINNFTVYYETTEVGEKYTGWLKKDVSDKAAVINLEKTTANGKYVTVIMRNSKGERRGSTYLQVGTRKEFASTGTAGQKYRLGIRKTYNTDGLSATLYGSWSPDRN